MIPDQKIRNIIKHYKNYRDLNPDTWIEFCKTQSKLEDAIRVAALCINHENKRHPHQYRIPQKSLDELYIYLRSRKRKIMESKNFDEVFSLVDSANIFMIGDLTKYDVAHRIGEYLGVHPDKVFIHSGTKTGAERLIGKIKSRSLSINHLPKLFLESNLTCAEIEDILCIYKEKFRSEMFSNKTNNIS